MIDIDVHHGFFEEMDLLPYVPKAHRERFEMYGLYPSIELFQNNGGYRGGQADLAYDDPSIPLDGRERSVDRCRRALLDEGEIDIAILMDGQMSPTSSASDSRYASVLCRAFNEWSLEHWVAEGDRFRLALMVCANDPQGAVEVIERVAVSPVEIEPTSDGLTIRGIPFEVIQGGHPLCAGYLPNEGRPPRRVAV